ncbi:dynein axonemal heavy chain 10-like [Homarus americanus]|uniref:dynein axonemal heavy chain 10-like n=1 Tax=Homarus americanus TaxID=6706 RepID=UPI001C4825BF|nr:dynein axonemal heavy chain 10-like [Homarus americanus]
MAGRGSDDDKEVENEELDKKGEVAELRVWWVMRRVCHLLGYTQDTRQPMLTWPQYPDHHHPTALLSRFLDEAAAGACLFFWQEQDLNNDLDAPTAPYPAVSNTATMTFSWKFDDNAVDDTDDDNGDHGFVVETYTQVVGADLVLQVQEGAFPPVVGCPGVLLKKVAEGTVQDVSDTTQAQELLPHFLHVTYLHAHTHLTLYSIFNEVYMPLCERLGKSDRTTYLASLSHNFSRLSKLRLPDPPLDYDSDEDEEAQKQAVPVGIMRETGSDTEDQKREQGEKKGDEEEEKKVKSLRTLLLNNVKRMNNKYSQMGGDVTLEELRHTWTNSFMELSASLAHIYNHPLLKNREEEEEEEREEVEALQESVVAVADQHNDLSDCNRSLFYLHKFIKVVNEGRLETLAGHAVALLDVLLLVWRLGRRRGISGKVQLILESSVESLVDLVTHELRPVNLLPSNMRETQPFLDSHTRVTEALQVVAEWETAVAQCAKTVFVSAKRQRDGRQDFDPKKVLSTIASLRSVCNDLGDIMKVLLEAQVGFSGEWSALIRVQDPDQLKAITSQVLRCLTAYDFNIFSTRNQDRWVRQKEDFQLAVQKWEQAVSSAITESFKDRMTSELVTAVAGVLQKEPCREKFRQMLISRLPDLLSAFAAEVKGIRADFKAQQQIERPGTQAPLSGRVRWMATYLTKRLAAWTTLKALYSQYQVVKIALIFK